MCSKNGSIRDHNRHKLGGAGRLCAGGMCKHLPGSTKGARPLDGRHDLRYPQCMICMARSMRRVALLFEN